MKKRERTKAPIFCAIFTLIAIVGIVIGILSRSPLIIILLLLPTAVYEVIRTEGKSTKAASIILLIVLIGEIFLILFNVDFNLADFFGTDRQMVGGFWLPLGDIKTVGPLLMAILSIILFTRTWGTYTRWLAVVILITSLAIIYSLDPTAFQEMLRLVLERGVRLIR